MTDKPEPNSLALWNRFADIDPKFTKKITGKPYQGTSPNPQYVIRCLTEMFGPVGQGFGWEVVREDFQPLGDEVLHWCRIKFWWTLAGHLASYESYGQTKALMKTKSGLMSDEDAPKKSLTDAIVKAASHLGIAANIFLGRWDDQKYVADVGAGYRAADAGQSEIKFNAVACRDRLLASLAKRKTKQDIADWWKSESEALGDLKDADAPKFAEVRAAVKAAGEKAEPAKNDDLKDDIIPY